MTILEVMRRQKAEYLEYQRQLALQRMAEQERQAGYWGPQPHYAARPQHQGKYPEYPVSSQTSSPPD